MRVTKYQCCTHVLFFLYILLCKIFNMVLSLTPYFIANFSIEIFPLEYSFLIFIAFF